jgi:hypothetical protein
MSNRIMIKIFLAAGILTICLLACQLTGNSKVAPTTTPTAKRSLEVSPADNPGKVETTIAGPSNKPTMKSAFPLPDGTNIVQINLNAVTGTVKLSMDDIVSFYRTEFSRKGLSEDKNLTFFSDNTFSIVFKGSSKGKNIIVQGTKMGEDMVAFSVRNE